MLYLFKINYLFVIFVSGAIYYFLMIFKLLQEWKNTRKQTQAYKNDLF